MKRSLVLVALVFACAFQTQAQLLQFGLRGGLNSSTIKIDEKDTWDVNRESEFGFHAGLFTRVQAPVIGLYVQPELLFSSTGGKVSITDDANNFADQVVDYDFNRIDIPVMVGWKFTFFRINAGPTFNIITKAEQTINGQDVVNIKDEYKSATVGYQAGVGVDLGPLLVDLKYEGSLSGFGDSVTFPGVNESFVTDQRTKQVILSLGLKL